MDVSVFSADIRDHDCELMAASLSADCRLRLVGITHPRRRAQFILGRVLLRHALRGRFGAAADGWRLDASRGKPRLVGVDAPEISLSHARHLVVCATARFDIGLDVEECRTRDFVALAAQICPPLELARFLSLPIDERCVAFYRMWTLKEAIYKLHGGVVAPPEQIGLSSPEEAALRHVYFQPEAGFLGAVVACSSCPPRLILHPLMPTELGLKR